MLARAATFYRGFLVMLLFVIGGMAGATQYVAHWYGYHPALGEPLFSIGAHKFYAPVMWWIWLFSLPNPRMNVFDTGQLIMTGFIVAGIFVFIYAVTMRKRQSSGKFGTARWATDKELARYKGHNGVIVGTSGKKKDRRGRIPKYITHDGPEHVALIAPSRSGKGASTIIPTLFRWTDSAFVLDIKGENWTATSGWRSTFSKCFRFDPASPDSAKFNPLQEIRLDHNLVGDVDLIASMLVDPEGTKTNPNHWDITARGLLKIVILHCRLTDPNASLGSVKEWLNKPGVEITDKLDEMMLTKHLGDHPHPVVAEGVQTLKDKYFPELSSILSTARSYLGIYDDQILAHNTSSSDFTIDSLLNDDKPVTLHIVFTPSNLQRLRFFLRLFVSLVVRKLTDVNVAPAEFPHKRRGLFLLDEFPRLGNLALLHDAIGYLAGYGIKCMIVAQSVKDLVRIYGREQTLLENSAVQIIHGTNDPDTADYVSRMVGTKTHREEEMNVSGNRLAPILMHTFVSHQENARALLTPGEVQDLPRTQQLFFAPDIAPALIEKIKWWEDPFMRAHSAEQAPPVPRDHVPPVNPWAGLTVEPVEIPASERDETEGHGEVDHISTGRTIMDDPGPVEGDPDEPGREQQSELGSDDNAQVRENDNGLFRI
ncbi:type IV secretory system conjugative DNA transfer family protein [Nisaea sediminum]|uniref:type IV secretory system conjugative DNA transfer family protein n=4 Tax=Pseudomonadota TaxID=1224 RepID=UPI001867B88F|nr:type IV secretory system conjugative DNA transfer family protein [Nisaea sediminum]